MEQQINYESTQCPKNIWARLITVIIIVIIIGGGIFWWQKILKESVLSNPVIDLSKNKFSRGDTVNATFVAPPNKKYYIFGSSYKLYKLNKSKEWEFVKIYTYQESNCPPYCINNTISPDMGCRQLWVLGVSLPPRCEKIDENSPSITSFKWDLQLQEYKEDTCGNGNGVFKFVNLAPSGQYKLQFQYFEDRKCKIPKFIEKLFLIE